MSTSGLPEHKIWIESVEKRLGAIKENPNVYSSIYKVPTKLRQLEEHVYTPSTVSIGPFHHGRSDLHAMEEHKWLYMLSFLQRTPDGIRTLKKCADALQDFEQVARRYYAENIGPSYHSRSDLLAMEQKNWRCMLSLLHQALNPRKNSDECAISESKENTGKYYADQHTNCNKEAEASFLEILLVDGCFILELLLRCTDKKFKDEDDPITSNAWMVPAIRRDLALLENQIPFEVLQKLFDTVRLSCSPTDPLTSACSCSLPEHAMLFFQPVLNTDRDPSISKELGQYNRHFLGMLHKFYLPQNPPIKCSEDKKACGFRYCATELSEAGIKFKNGTQGRLLDITTSKGVVVIPPFSIDETLDLLLRNLIAFEQCSFRTTHHISSYVFLMSGLIKSSNDIKFLQSKGILTNILGKAEDASTFFSRMYNGVVLKEFYFTELCEEVNAYTKSWWHYHRIKALLQFKCRRYLHELISDYFSNPWRAASAFAAVVLLVLTVLQTIYTMRA
ncbi:unnamed protein product [Ilex paraguariensis]|uniref:Uncharacterized protein n=1 Tax=Ilex paraguariensis TaxID=185542 RepID=A0ABC8U5Q7_9AQUA